MKFEIAFTPTAAEHLRFFRKFEQKIILDPKQAGYIIPNWPTNHVTARQCDDVPSTAGAPHPLACAHLSSASLIPISALECPQGSGHPDPDFTL